LHCGLTRQGKICEYHPAHSFLFIIIIFDGYMLLLHQSPCALYIALGTLFLHLLVEDFCLFCPTLPGHPCRPVATPVASPVTLPDLPCRLPCHFARPHLSVSLSVSHVSPPCVHKLEFVFCRPR